MEREFARLSLEKIFKSKKEVNDYLADNGQNPLGGTCYHYIVGTTESDENVFVNLFYNTHPVFIAEWWEQMEGSPHRDFIYENAISSLFTYKIFCKASEVERYVNDNLRTNNPEYSYEIGEEARTSEVYISLDCKKAGVNDSLLSLVWKLQN